MCEGWWFHRRAEEREASRQLWEEFDRTTPLTGPEETEEEPEVILEKPEPTRLAVKD
jgi:hypothetical protein